MFNLSLEFAKNLAADFTNSRGIIKKSVKISEIRGKKDSSKINSKLKCLNSAELNNQFALMSCP